MFWFILMSVIIVNVMFKSNLYICTAQVATLDLFEIVVSWNSGIYNTAYCHAISKAACSWFGRANSCDHGLSSAQDYFTATSLSLHPAAWPPFARQAGHHWCLPVVCGGFGTCSWAVRGAATFESEDRQNRFLDALQAGPRKRPCCAGRPALSWG